MNQPDVTMMFFAHNAFRRDVARMRSAAADVDEPGIREALRSCWSIFHQYLTVHHTAEDKTLWPSMREKRGGQIHQLLDEMVDEHNRLHPLVDEIDSLLPSAPAAHLNSLFGDLADALAAHFEHEETAALPLVRETLSTREWDAFGDDQRRRVGLRGAAWFFPWLLDEAPQDTRDYVLSLVPSPIRLLHWVLWEPHYRRASPWR